MSTAPHVHIDLASFWHDPYPTYARLRRAAPIAFVPQLHGTVFARRDDIFVAEKIVDIFSSHQPAGLMNTLMGHNMMRKDGDAHMAERQAFFPGRLTQNRQGHMEREVPGARRSHSGIHGAATRWRSLQTVCSAALG
jgi:cytochrome P450